MTDDLETRLKQELANMFNKIIFILDSLESSQ